MDFITILNKMVRQYFIILAGTIIAATVYCTFLMSDAVITIDYLWWILLFCALADLPIFVYYSREELTKKQWNIRTILHTILLEIVLLFAGKMLGMYQGIYDGSIFAIIILLIDVLVRVMTYTKDWKMADDINQKLRERKGKSYEEK
ncbi:MAG: hypothetical protein Q4B70_09150 [Lachnospiraceae bacterium]|nr:hypothetical protein [Lachnospiraceae bacterium]